MLWEAYQVILVIEYGVYLTFTILLENEEKITWKLQNGGVLSPLPCYQSGVLYDLYHAPLYCLLSIEIEIANNKHF